MEVFRLLGKVHFVMKANSSSSKQRQGHTLRPCATCLQTDSIAIEKYVLALKFSSGQLSRNRSKKKGKYLIWSNFGFAVREKLAALDIFYRVINVTSWH